MASLLSRLSAPLKKQATEVSENTLASIDEGVLERGQHLLPQPTDAFADNGDGGVVYKTNSYWQTGALMAAEIVSLGVLSLPRAMRVLGLIPCVLALIGFGLLSLYAGTVYGYFKLAYPHVATISDAGRVLFGPIGEWVFGISSVVVLVFIVAAHIGSFSIAMNVLTHHGTCSIIFAVAATAVSIVCSLPRKLEDLAILSVICTSPALLQRSSADVCSLHLDCVGSVYVSGIHRLR